MISKKVLTKLYVTGTLAGGLVLAGAGTALAATASPTITVTPSSGITSGSAVQVAGSGLNANDVYHIGECAAEGSQYACDSANAVNVTSSASGTLSAPLTVVSSFTATTEDGTTYSVNCATQSCVVGVYDSSFNGGAVPITFAGG